MTALLIVAAAVSATPAPAQDRPAPAATGPCVEVDIGGQRTGTLECVNQTLGDARSEARAASGGGDPASARASTLNARSADHRVGLTNDAAFRQRMGAAYGVSIRPQRPTPVHRPILPVPSPLPR